MKNIIVGTDESTESANAVRFAHRLAKSVSARLVMVESSKPTSTEHSPAELGDYESSVKERLAGWLAGKDAGGAEIVIVDVPARPALLGAANRTEADAVVIGSRQTEGFTKMGIGSLAHQLAHELECPLIVVPPTELAPTGNVVVGIDGSDASRVALQQAADMADALGGTAYAVYAIKDIYTTFNSAGYYGKEEQQARSEADEHADRVQFIERLGGRTEHILADVADEHGAEVIVVSARDRWSIGGLFLGEVPDHLLHEPPRPVMVIPHTVTEAAFASEP
ncbi:MAG: universal stress protein [Acidimicrobiales bacterium]|nr:universal stress protein [Acidimicrobiales bacterium]